MDMRKHIPPEGRASARPGPEVSLQDRLASVLLPRGELVFRDHAGTGVPAQEGVVVAGGPDFFRFLELLHRLTEFVVGVMAGPGMPLRQFRLRSPFGQDSGVIGALIFAFNLREEMISLRLAHPIAFTETIS